MNIRLAIVDDHNVVAESLAHALLQSPSVTDATAFTDPHVCLDALSKGLEVDIVLSDYSMPAINGIDFCSAVRQLAQSTKCILLTMHDATELRYRARRAGIEGFLLKTSSMEEIRTYLEMIADGHVEKTWDESPSSSVIQVPVSLSQAEIEVVRCIICREMSTKQAAEYLYRSHHTIEQHRKNIYAKLQIDSIAALAKYALGAGICSGLD